MDEKLVDIDGDLSKQLQWGFGLGALGYQSADLNSK